MRFEFSDFSKKRSQLMGISMLLIMVFHSGMMLQSRYTQFGDVGVEFFLVISAIGLFFSLSKNNNKRVFYKKRVLRILPTYLIVAAPYFAHNQEFSIGNYLINLSGLCILYNNRFFWFIGEILICYLLAPFYFEVMKKHKLSIVIPFVTLAVCYLLGQCFPPLAIMLIRFAIFFLGLHLAKLVYDKQVIDSWLVLPVCLLSLILIPVIGDMPIPEEQRWLAFFFLSIPALGALVMMLDKCPSFISQSLAFVGGITLETYLLHERICLRAMELLFGQLLGAVLSFPVCIFLAYLLSKLMKIVNKHLLPTSTKA